MQTKIAALGYLGQNRMNDDNRAELALCKQELQKVEHLMRDAGQEP